MCSDGVGMRMQVSLTAGLGIWRLEPAGPGASSDFFFPFLILHSLPMSSKATFTEANSAMVPVRRLGCAN